MTEMLSSQDAATDGFMSEGWTELVAASAIPVDRGIAALVQGPLGPEPVAVFRLSPVEPDGADEWCAVSHIDPVTGSPVIARGLVGSLDQGLDSEDPIPTVASPLLKQRYNLRTGRCLDDPSLALAVYDVTVVQGLVLARPKAAAAAAADPAG